MANTIKIKRSSTANAVPTSGSLEYGELALNYTDGNLFFKTASNTVTLLASTQTGNYSGNVTANYFIGNANIQYTASVGPPTGNLIGAQWYDTGSDVLYEYQTDGTSTYWVDITGPTVGSVVSVSGNYGNSNVAVFLAAFGSNSISTTGNATVGNAHVGNIISDNIIGLNAVFNGSVLVTDEINITGNITSGNVNANQYQVNGKQAVNGPAFRAYIAVGQTITSGSQQKVTFGSETFDTNNNFASSRFTPTVEGYYQLNATVRISGGSGTGECMITIWKNGSEYARGTNESGTEQGAGWYSMQVSDLAYANGSTDYFEIYIQQTSGSNKDTTAGTNISYFSGAMVRGA